MVQIEVPLQQDLAFVREKVPCCTPYLQHLLCMSPTCYKMSCGAWHIKAVNAANGLHTHFPVQHSVLLATAGLTHVSA